MRKIKILYGLEAVGGGALKHLLYLTSHLDKELYEVTAILSNRRNENVGYDMKKIEDSGTNVIYLPIPRKIHILNDFIVFIQISTILRKQKFDIIHAHSSKAGGLLRLAAYFAGNKKVLYTPHCFYFQGLSSIKRRLFITLERILAKLTTYIIVSEGEKNVAIENKIIPESKILNINNAIDFAEFVFTYQIIETLNRYSIPKGKFIVGAVGRLVEQKDWKTFVFAANEVLKIYPETIFIIAGEGKLRNNIKELIFKLGLKDNIVLTGFVKDIHKIYGVIDIFVNTSLWEGLPYVILEAMKYKKPIVATDTGIEGVITNEKNGFITPIRDYKTIAEKIIELIENKEKMINMGIESNAILAQKYSFELFIKKHEELYEKIAFNSD